MSALIQRAVVDTTAHSAKQFDVSSFGRVALRTLRHMKVLTASKDGQTVPSLAVSQVDKALATEDMGIADKIAFKLQLLEAGILVQD
jgi:hypothetical protein